MKSRREEVSWSDTVDSIITRIGEFARRVASKSIVQFHGLTKDEISCVQFPRQFYSRLFKLI